MIIAAIAVATTGTMALSGPKPKGAKPADSQTIANHYVGMTRIWNFCEKKGGIYFGGGWEATVYCPRNGGEMIAIGTWSVKKGTLCRDMTFYFEKNGQVNSRHSDEKGCIHHVVDPDGTIWRSFEDNNNWGRLPAAGERENEVKGNKYKSKFNRMKKAMKL